MSTTPRTDAMFHSYVSDPHNDGGYVLQLNKEETEELFRRIGSFERELRNELTALRKELAEVTAAFQQECDHEWENVDDSFSHDRGTEIIHYRRCLKCGKHAEPDDGPGPDDEPPQWVHDEYKENHLR